MNSLKCSKSFTSSLSDVLRYDNFVTSIISSISKKLCLFNIKIFNSWLINPTKPLCISVPEPYWHLICNNFMQRCRLCIKFSAILDKILINLVLIYNKNTSSSGAIWDAFSKQHQQLKHKSTIFNARLALF